MTSEVSRVKRVRAAAFIVLVSLGVGPPQLLAQAIDRSVERVSAALQAQSPLRLTAPTWAEPPPKQIGVFTLVPPTSPGEIVRLRLPIGELVSRTARGIARANQRRREVAARLEVQGAVTAFTSKPKNP